MFKKIFEKSIVFYSILAAIFSLYFYYSSVSILTIGGLYLMFGAWYVATGNVYYSIIVYTLADVCWLINTYNSNDLFAAITVSVGIATGLYVTYRMRQGTFRKSILRDLNE